MKYMDNYWKIVDKMFTSTDLDHLFKPIDSIVTEHKNGDVVVSLDMPGFKKEEVEVSVTPGYLHISAKNDKKRFTKSFTLSDNYIFDKIEAKLDLGILTVTIPFNAPSVQSRKIEVK